MLLPSLLFPGARSCPHRSQPGLEFQTIDPACPFLFPCLDMRSLTNLVSVASKEMWHICGIEACSFHLFFPPGDSNYSIDKKNALSYFGKALYAFIIGGEMVGGRGQEVWLFSYFWLLIFNPQNRSLEPWSSTCCC